MQKIGDIEMAYDEMLEECISLDQVFKGRKADVYKEMDPIAYRVGMADFTSDGEKWECPECNEWYALEGESEPELCDDCAAAHAEEDE